MMRATTFISLLVLAVLLTAPALGVFAPAGDAGARDGADGAGPPASPLAGPAGEPEIDTEQGGAGSSKAGTGANWTLMVYMAADNSREQGALDAVNAMESADIDQSRVQVLVQVDRIAGYSNADGDWSGARRYFLSHDDDEGTIGSDMVGNLGEVNMANPVVLADFLKWGISNYPAENYAVILWGHGYGIDGVLKDDVVYFYWHNLPFSPHFHSVIESLYFFLR